LTPENVVRIRLGQIQRLAVRITKSKLAGKAPNGLPSTGILALLFCLHFRAKSVELTGFGITIPEGSKDGTQHFYDAQNSEGPNVKRVMRSHSSADLLILSSMGMLGYPIETDCLELDSALMNWGYSGQHFYKKSFLTSIFWFKFAPW
jgi:hypothetical protein